MSEQTQLLIVITATISDDVMPLSTEGGVVLADAVVHSTVELPTSLIGIASHTLAVAGTISPPGTLAALNTSLRG